MKYFRVTLRTRTREKDRELNYDLQRWSGLYQLLNIYTSELVYSELDVEHYLLLCLKYDLDRYTVKYFDNIEQLLYDFGSENSDAGSF